MTILVPSYHKEGREISQIFNRPEVYFFVRPKQADWYKTNFPKANTLELIPDNDPVGIMGITRARNTMVTWWRQNKPTEIVFMVDDDIVDFLCNDAPQGKKYSITIDKAYEILSSYIDDQTTMVGLTYNDMNIYWTPDKIKEHGEAPEACFVLGPSLVGNYLTDEETFENQWLGGHQLENGKKWKVIYRLLYKRYKNNNDKNSAVFPGDQINNNTTSQRICDNTLRLLPKLTASKQIILKKFKNNSTVKLWFQKPKQQGFGIA